MFIHPQFDPVALAIGPLQMHWYGLMYVLGFLGFLIIGKMRARQPGSVMTPDRVDDMMFWGAIGVVAGGRIGYMLFYNLKGLLADPVSFFYIWDGGMSFHGGLLGVILAMFLLARRWKLRFFEVSDFVAPLVPIGLFTGRIGNFINAELYGRHTDVPWAVVFPNADNLPRHPSQLYQALLEGVILFVLLHFYRKASPPVGAISGLFLVGYGIARILAEFVREPDAHIGYLAGGITQGQLLSLPMVLLGLFFMWGAYKKAKA
ncbi:prolipoprotein diacylglyceryl transferase [Candidatus Thiothrix anitrata]|jgi:phosphatidylglycerol:prolipoprotein diacylglycerol transferase|uniref:Phosphatidylglycerol--prolipoprotein diacylglyceryl transferase n=1 Tax=Candidatus Thiothrix anitrata TaxID=2823902 RepID=A0ABX7X212_9GAMM|nr:prolipoprotein diacylglyceryl transferase [Candidatus Thiothrix anitrata]QTR49422.1 prolipoprotein diacylglyceryl transferase [Candidatus Thiothrix anitrata]